MRSAALSAFVSFLTLRILLIHASPLCHTVTLPEWAITSFSSLYGGWNGSVEAICTEVGTDAQRKVHSVGQVVVTSVAGTKSATTQECINAFLSVFANCVGSQKVNGGLVHSADGVVLDIYHTGFQRNNDEGKDSENLSILVDSKDLARRGNRGGRRLPKGGQRHTKSSQRRPKSEASKQRTSKKKSAHKKKPTNKKKPAHKKPAQKKPTHKKPAHKKPTHNDPGKTKSHSARASKTSASVHAVPTKSCKQVYDIIAKDLKAEDAENSRKHDLISRGSLFDELLDMDDHEKRASEKPGTVCGMSFKALRYPQVNEMPSDAPYYSMKYPKICDNMDFARDASSKAKGLEQADYEIEHVLEWQVVVKFFEWLEKKFEKDSKNFKNPDHRKKEPVKFCKYWKETWSGSFPPMFKLNDKGEEGTALDHLRSAYPGRHNFIEEFVYLQRTVNSPAKSQMWDDKPTLGIFGERGKGRKGTANYKPGMSEAIMGVMKGRGKNKAADPANIDHAREAFIRLKHLLGARLYLKSPKIEAIFKKQKERIGDMLDTLDQEMENHPRVTTALKFNAWERQGLKTYWNEYMDEKFEIAKRRADNDMTKYLGLLERHWHPKGSTAHDKDVTVFYGQIKRLRAAWTMEKAKPWTVPW